MLANTRKKLISLRRHSNILKHGEYFSIQCGSSIAAVDNIKFNKWGNKNCLSSAALPSLAHDRYFNNKSNSPKQRFMILNKDREVCTKQLSTLNETNAIGHGNLINRNVEVTEENIEEIGLSLSELITETTGFLHKLDPDLTTAKKLINLWLSPYRYHHDSIKQAQQILDHVIKFTVTSDVSPEYAKILSSSLNQILMVLIKKGEIQSAIRYFQQRQKNADTSTFHFILNMCATNRLAQEAEDVLLQMTKHASQSNLSPSIDYDDLLVTPDTKSFNLVLKAQRLPQRAESILKRMITLWQVDGHENIKPDIISFNTVMNCYVKWDNEMNNHEKTKIKRSEHVEKIIKLINESKDTDVQPNASTYNIFLHAHSIDGDPHLAEQLFLEMMNSENLPNPDAISYATCLNAYVKNGEVEKAEQMLQNPSFNEGYSYPSTFAYNSVIHALCKARKTERAEEVFNYMKTDPDLDTFNTLIDGYSLQNKPESAHRILNQLEDYSKKENESDDNVHVAPNSFSYNSVITAYSSLGRGERAASILQRMEIENQNGNRNVLPDTISFNIVLSAYLKEKGDTLRSVSKAQSLLSYMEELHQSGNKAVHPDIISYTTVMKCWARSKQRNVFSKINLILSKLEQLEDERNNGKNSNINLDVDVYNVYLSAFANTDILSKSFGKEDVADLAFNIIHRMLSRSKEHNNPTVRPDIVTYNTILNILVKHGQVERAHDLLMQMDNGTLDLEDGTPVRPETVTYNTILAGFAKAGDAKRAKALLEKMNNSSQSIEEINVKEEVFPDKHSLNIVISAFAKNGDTKGAEQILQAMKDQYQHNSKGETVRKFFLIKPDCMTYTSMMSAYTKSHSAKSYIRIKELLSEMKEDWNISPDTVCLNVVIDALAKSNEKSKARKAMNFFQQMQTTPNFNTLNGVLRACLFTDSDDEQMEATQIIVQILEDMFRIKGKHNEQKRIESFMSHIKPNHVTFSIMIKACNKFLSKSKSDKRMYLEKLFSKACESGQVSSIVWKDLINSLNEEEILFLLEKIMGKNEAFKFNSNNRNMKSIKMNDLPRRWSRNIKYL